VFNKKISLDYERSLHSVKTAIACLLGLLVTKIIPLPVDQWLIITIVVVMCAQVSIGGLLQKSYMRFLGTVAGTLIAAITLLFFGAQLWVIVLVLGFSAMMFSYFATSPSVLSDAGTLGAATVTIILIAHNPTLQMAMVRFIEITLGIVIALLTSRFIFPLRAQNHLQREIVSNLERLQKFYGLILAGNYNSAPVQDLENAIINSFVGQRKLIKEAARENFSHLFDLNSFNHLVVCQRELLRSMDFIHYAMQLSKEGQQFLQEVIKIDKFNESVEHDLANLAKRLASPADASQIPPLALESHDLSWANTAMTTLLAQVKNLTPKDIQHLNLILFCAKVLADRLHELSHYLKRLRNGGLASAST